jgi:hypothetical protein
MLRTKKPRKLAVNRESLRLLTSDELAKAAGGVVNTTVDWCSTDSQYKCKVNGGVCAVRK